MDYLNVLVPTLRAPPFLGATTHELGVWMRVMAYCCGQENGGRIDGAGLWTSDMLLFSLGVTASDLKKCGRLVTVEGTDIVAVGYPERSQKALNAKRKAAELTNMKRWRSDNATESHSESHSDNASESHSESERERERERETPKPPEGALSEGEIPFVRLSEILRESGKFSAGVTPATLAVLWRNLNVAGRPDDPGVVEHLTAAAASMPGKVSAPGPWLAARVAEVVRSGGQKNYAAADAGPGAGEM